MKIDTTIDTKRAALAALRKLGFSKSLLQMTRGATTYSHPEADGFLITVSDTQFIATGTVARGAERGSTWGHISMGTQIGNLRVGASERVLQLLSAARERGLIDDATPVTVLGLGLVCAAGALHDARGGRS